MADAAALIAFAVDSPADLTMRAFDRWLGTLSARERAELSWARPGLAAALDSLVEGPLHAAAIDGATREVVQVIFGCRAVFKRGEGGAPMALLAEALRARSDRLTAFLQSEDAFSQIVLVASVLVEASRVVLERLRGGEGAEDELDEAVRKMRGDEGGALLNEVMTSPAGDLLRAETLLVAALEAADRGSAAERGRALARLSLLSAVESVRRLRLQGFDVAVHLDEPADRVRDRVLLPMARLALDDAKDPTGATDWVRACVRSSELAAKAPADARARFPRRLVRREVIVMGALFVPTPKIVLYASSEGVAHVLYTTAELVERALSLRGTSVNAVLVDTGEVVGGEPKLELLRLDPVSESAPDSQTRARDIVSDWNELLHRLAK